MKLLFKYSSTLLTVFLQILEKAHVCKGAERNDPHESQVSTDNEGRTMEGKINDKNKYFIWGPDTFKIPWRLLFSKYLTVVSLCHGLLFNFASLLFLRLNVFSSSVGRLDVLGLWALGPALHFVILFVSGIKYLLVLQIEPSPFLCAGISWN